MKNNVLINVALFILLAISIGFNIGQWYTIKKDREYFKNVNYEQIRDTVVNYLHNFDTVYVERWHQSPTQYVYDTIHVENKVYIRDTVQAYEFREKDYDLAVGAVKLDWYKLDIHATDTIHYPHTTIVNKQKRFNVALQGGVGYGIINKKPDVFVGVGVSYNIY